VLNIVHIYTWKMNIQDINLRKFFALVIIIESTEAEVSAKHRFEIMVLEILLGLRFLYLRNLK